MHRSDGIAARRCHSTNSIAARFAHPKPSSVDYSPAFVFLKRLCCCVPKAAWRLPWKLTMALDTNESGTYDVRFSSPKPVPLERRLCRKSLPIRLTRPRPALCCFPKVESRNLNHLVLIPFRLARATRAGGSPREAPATQAVGRAASAIPGGGCLTSWRGH